MTSDRFLEKFDLFADAPNAVAKMRELAVSLAVQGKLVAQEPSDPPATELLKSIEVEAVRLARLGLIKKSGLEPIAQSEAPFAIPTSWVWTRLGCIADWGSGSTPPKEGADYYGGGITWLRSGELNDNRQLALSEETITDLALEQCTFRRNRRGDVLLAMYGATIGKVAILAEDAVTNQAVCGCTPFPGVFNQYLFFFLLSQRKQFHLASEGGAQPNISKWKIIRTPFPLPPLPEQHRIVSKLDELMTLCDRLEAQQHERELRETELARASLARFSGAPTPANLNFLFHKSYSITPVDMRKAIMSLAVQGKLVPQDPKDEPASKLLDRAEALRMLSSPIQQAKSLRRVRELDPSTVNAELPESWRRCRLGDLAIEFRYGTSRKCSSGSGAVPVLRIPNINVDMGSIDLTDLKFTDMPSSEFEQLRLQVGDLLIIRSNGSEGLVGRSAVVTETEEGYAFAGYLVRLRVLKEVVSPLYLHLALSSPSTRDQVERPIRTTSGVKNINTTELSNLVLPLPPFAEQIRIVAKVIRLMGLVGQLETHQLATSWTGANLLDAVVAELAA